MKKVFLILLAMTSPAFGQEMVSHLDIPVPSGQKAPVDPEIQNLVWNKWDTPNFIILSLDKQQGRYLYENIELMKKWASNRWGLPDVKFSSECKVLCVPNRELMKKLFRLDNSYGEVRRKDGKITISVLWLVLDGKPAELIPSALTEACVSEYEQSIGNKCGWWFHRGSSILNQTLPQIRGQISNLQKSFSKDSKMFFSQSLFSMTEDQWLKETAENKLLFDQEAAALTLLLRKEFGQKMLHTFLMTKQSEQDFVAVYGFANYAEFDATLKRYMFQLSGDIIANRTPNSYLEISPPK